MNIINIFKKREYIIGFLFLLLYFIGLLIYSLFNQEIFLPFSFSISVGCYLCFIFLESEFESNTLRMLQIKFERRLSIILAINLISIISSLKIVVNRKNYHDFAFDCQFVNHNDSYIFDNKKICVLYNIKKDDTFPYKYICTFNAKEDPLNFSKEQLICSKIEKLVNNNEIIDAFIKENYKEENFYFCDSKHQPTNENDCKSKTKYIQFLYSKYFIFYIYLFVRYIILNINYFQYIKVNIKEKIYMEKFN